jgi:hypothetical protein
VICVTAQGIAQQAAEKAAGRHPETGQFRREVAFGHGIYPNGDQSMDHMLHQPIPLEPVPLADLATTAAPEGALGSPFAEHHGEAHVQRFDAARWATNRLMTTLGGRQSTMAVPSGIPGQPSVHTAPTGVGAQFRVSPPRPPEAWMIPPAGGF